ncbi:hypothetical protein Tco_0812996 [Tanacetum coccineum]|uniref:Uncharacterized protein n=1 Tax=Tanacetum coccineum TaxID=301880 RepID=A0ABQ5HPU4_9ASTR
MSKATQTEDGTKRVAIAMVSLDKKNKILTMEEMLDMFNRDSEIMRRWQQILLEEARLKKQKQELEKN